MKKLFVIVFLAGCSDQLQSDKVREFIPGTYSRHYRDEYWDSYDTLKIMPITASGSEGYLVISKMKYQKFHDGNLLPLEYKTKQWSGRYENDSKTLIVEQSGARIYFDPLKGEANMGEVPYKKLK